ncbi:MAG: hypothetical protein DDT33_00838 [Firmicutes bacterium]|nr:hypothetical protein [Bacillota bacterium]
MKIFEGQPRKAIDQLDKTLAFVGLLSSLILTIWLAMTIGRPIYVTVGVLVSLACAGYLLLRRNLPLSAIASIDQIRASPWLYKVLNTLFFLLFLYSILSIHLSPELYTRPLVYFIATALMAAIVAVEILFLPSHKSHTYFALFKIIIIGLSLRWSQQLIFPGLVGVDPWTHEGYVLQVLDAGHVLPILGQYYYMPFFHLLTGVTMLITNLDYRIGVMFSITLFQVLSDTLFIFLLGRFIVSHKVALLAPLLLGVANMHITFGFWLIPNTMSTILILPVIYLLFKMRGEVPVRSMLLSLFFMIALILTHAFALWLAILLFVFLMGGKIRNKLYHERSVMPATLGITSMFTILMLGYWMHITGHLTELAIFIREGFREDLGVITQGLLAEAAGRHALLIPFLEQLFNNIGMLLLFTLSFIGCFYMISKKFGNIYAFVFAIGGGTILAIGFIPLLTGHGIIEYRWHLFAQTLLAIPLAVALLLLCQICKERFAKAGIISFIVFLLAFFMIMSSNIDNHTFAPNTKIRVAFTESEFQAFDTISGMWDNEIGADSHVFWPFLHQFEGEIIQIDESLLTGDFRHDHEMLIMIREEIVERPFQVHLVGNIRLDHDPRPILAEQGFSRIYDNGSVAGFLKLQ